MPERKIDNLSEKEFRDNQNSFGHLHKDIKLDAWLKNTYEIDLVRKERYKKIASNFLGDKKDLKVLEIAAGVGDFVLFCAKLFPFNKYYANDLSEVQLKNNINEVAEYFGVNFIPELSFGPVENLSYEDNQFDLIFIKAAVHHFEDPTKGMEEMYRILKPGGKLICFEEPVCLNIPIYKNYRKRNFANEERSLGLNEHIYTIKEYLNFGKIFKDKRIMLDEILVSEYDIQQVKRVGLMKIIGTLIRNISFIFKNFMVWRFSCVIFIFTKD